MPKVPGRYEHDGGESEVQALTLSRFGKHGLQYPGGVMKNFTLQG